MAKAKARRSCSPGSLKDRSKADEGADPHNHKAAMTVSFLVMTNPLRGAGALRHLPKQHETDKTIRSGSLLDLNVTPATCWPNNTLITRPLMQKPDIVARSADGVSSEATRVHYSSKLLCGRVVPSVIR